MQSRGSGSSGTASANGGGAIASVRWTAIGNLLRTVLGTLQIFILARLMSVSEFGLAVLVTSIVLVTQQISDAGLSSALIRYRDASDNEKSSLFWSNALVGLFLTAGCFFLAPWISSIFSAPSLNGMLRFASVIFLIQSLFLQIRVLAERDMHFGPVVRIELAATAVGFLVAVSMAAMKLGAISVVYGQVSSVTVQLALTWLTLSYRWKPKPHFRFSDVKRFLPYGADLFLANLATSVTVQADMLIAGVYFPKYTLGNFAQPRDLSLKVMTAINPIILRVGLPLIARHQDDARLSGSIYLKIIRMSASVCFPIYSAMALLAQDVIPLAFGRQWTDAAKIMPWIALWFAIRCIVSPLGTFMSAIGLSRKALYYQIAFALFIVVASYVGAQFGPRSMAISMLIIYLLFSQFCWFFVLRPNAKVRFKDYNEQIFAPMLCCLFGAIAFLITRAAIAVDGLIKIGGASIVGLVFFVLSNLVFNRPFISDARRLILPERQG